MTRIIFTDPHGREIEVDATDGLSVMRAAFDNGVEGITADCGGNCACATCHVYVDEAFWDKVGGPDDTEDAMLEFKDNRAERSRLTCQIQVTPELEGLRLTVPRE